MQIIEQNGLLLAIVLDGDIPEGTHPVTSPDMPLQVLSFKHQKGKIWPPHSHVPMERKTKGLCEAVVLSKGSLRASISVDGVVLSSVDLQAGQGIFVVSDKCEIQLEALENVIMYEFKNGPFVDDKKVL